MQPAPNTIRTRDEWQALNYSTVFAWRQQQLQLFERYPVMKDWALAYYAGNPIDFVNHWADTVDPRNAGQPGKLVRMPFVLFQRQDDLIEFFEACKNGQVNGLVEKVRTAGATWTACAYSVHQWRFVPGSAIGWGSRKEQLVDKIGDMDSIFEKMRSIIAGLPSFFWPKGFNPNSDRCMSYMRIVNPENGSTITGEAGDNIGRGGRKTIYFKDESAHYERPDKIEASLSENTRVQIDISSVSGTGNPFHRKRENGVEWRKGIPFEPNKTPVFIFDVFDHPANSVEWYEARKAKFKADGLGHVFAQEIDRNYFAAVEGIIIESEWVNACVDAHLYLRIDPENPETVIVDRTASIGQPYIDGSGPWTGSLDVADGGLDRSAWTARKGVILRRSDEWGDSDTGESARRVVGLATGLGEAEIEYDPVGVGAGVKTEINRLIKDGLMPKGLTWVAWNAGAAVRDPFKRIIPDDDGAPLNVDYFYNMKAQGWTSLMQRCYRTWQMMNGLAKYSAEELISIDGKIPHLHQIKKELSQPTRGKSTNLKMLVNKMPEGTKSPNFGDSVVMNYFPIPLNTGKAVFGTSGNVGR